MKLILYFIILLNFVAPDVACQSFSAKDLMTLSTLPSASIKTYMNKKGFFLFATQTDAMETRATFKERVNFNKSGTGPGKTLELYFKKNSKYFILNKCSLDEYYETKKNLIKSGFFTDGQRDIPSDTSVLFQKANISIEAKKVLVDSITQCRFILKQRVIPSNIEFAEDLLQFDSHEFLKGYFGAENVKTDMYFLTEKELKKCTVLFGSTQRQALFIWDDETNLNSLIYIIITNKLPTKGAEEDPMIIAGNNLWKLKNGVHTGMLLKELLEINQVDFDIYGNNSEFSFLIKPNKSGKIDFKSTAVMLDCRGCYAQKIFDTEKVSAREVAKANIPMRVFDLIIYSPQQDK